LFAARAELQRAGEISWRARRRERICFVLAPCRPAARESFGRCSAGISTGCPTNYRHRL